MLGTAVLFEVEASPAFACGERGGFTGHFVPSSTKSPSSLNSTSANVRTSDDAADNPYGSMKKRAQYTKTKMCPYLGSVHGCYDGDACAFAHNPRELRRRPDLAKTRLCTDFTLKGSCRRGDRCDFAHGYRELKSTASYYKTDLCKFWTTGVCHSGYLCRHAHGVHELRRYEPPPPPTPSAVQPLPGGASSESTTDMSSGNNSHMHVKSKHACLGDATDENRQTSLGRREPTPSNLEEKALYLSLSSPGDNSGVVDGGEGPLEFSGDEHRFSRFSTAATTQRQCSFSSRTSPLTPPPPHIVPHGGRPAANDTASADLHSLVADLAWLRDSNYAGHLRPHVEFQPVPCDERASVFATPNFVDHPQLMNDQPLIFSNSPDAEVPAENSASATTNTTTTMALPLSGYACAAPLSALSRATSPNLYSKLRLMVIFPGPTVSCVVTGNQVFLDEKYSQAMVADGTIFPQAQLVPPLLLNQSGGFPSMN